MAVNGLDLLIPGLGLSWSEMNQLSLLFVFIANNSGLACVFFTLVFVANRNDGIIEIRKCQERVLVRTELHRGKNPLRISVFQHLEFVPKLY